MITWVHLWFLVGSVLIIFLVFCVVFLVGSVLIIFLVFCVVFLVGSVLIIFLVFCVVFFALFVFILCPVYCELNHDIVYALLNKHHTKIQGLSWSWLYDAINAYHNFSCEFKTRSWRGVLDTTLCDQVCQCGFLNVLRFPSAKH